MNVFQATLLFTCFVAAKGNFPAVIFDGEDDLVEPIILELSDTEVEVGFSYHYIASYIACPLDQSQRENDANPEVLAWRKIVNVKETYNLDELLLCELQPKVSFHETDQAKEYREYSIGYKVYDRRIEDDHDGSRLYSGRDEHYIGEVFRMNFNTVTKQTISAEYGLYNSRFISTASNKKHTFIYEKNEEFLEINLDDLYQNFVDRILPRMVRQKSTNQLAHALGIQKVQLATPDDFALDTWKMATYWNINTVPLWRVLLLRWNAIEIYIRKVFKRNINIKIKTGVSGTLELAECYYENDTVHNLHIPKYVWKLIPDYSHNTAMLIVMHNDPFTEQQETLCADICTINGWLVSNDDYRTGLVYCCKMTEDIVRILGYYDHMKDYGIYSFTKDEDGTEKLKYVSRISSDPQEKLYDW